MRRRVRTFQKGDIIIETLAVHRRRPAILKVLTEQSEKPHEPVIVACHWTKMSGRYATDVFSSATRELTRPVYRYRYEICAT